MQFGQQNYYILNENGTEDYYKSSPYDVLLNINQSLQIKFTDRPDQMVEIVVPSVNEILLARKIETPAGGISPRLLYRLPKQAGDILYFESEAHLAEVQDLVRDYLADGPDNDINIQNKLNQIEGKFDGFNSYRTYFEKKYNLSTGSFTELEIEKILKEDFINDDVLKTFFNSYRLIGIGEKVHYYHQTDLILSFPIGNTQALEYVKEICRIQDSQDYDVFAPESGMYELMDYLEVTSGKYEIPFPSKGAVWVSPEYSYYSIPVQFHLPENCNPYKKGLAMELNKVYHENTQAGSQSTPVNLTSAGASLTIDWGDGVTEVFNNYDGSVKYHTYSSTNIYFPVTTLTFVDLYGVTRQIQDGNNTGGNDMSFTTSLACTDIDKNLWGQKTSGVWKMSCEIWVNHNMFGHHVGAATHAWKNTSGNTWQQRNARIKVHVEGIFRNDACEQTETKSDSKDHNSDKNIQVQETKFWAKYKTVGNGDVKSHHELIKDEIGRAHV